MRHYRFTSPKIIIIAALMENILTELAVETKLMI